VSIQSKCSVKKSYKMDAETYRRKAEQYFTFARQMSNPNSKAALIDVAAHWMEMAEQAALSEQQHGKVN
jgi:hypothetical protein